MGRTASRWMAAAEKKKERSHYRIDRAAETRRRPGPPCHGADVRVDDVVHVDALAAELGVEVYTSGACEAAGTNDRKHDVCRLCVVDQELVRVPTHPPRPGVACARARVRAWVSSRRFGHDAWRNTRVTMQRIMK